MTVLRRLLKLSKHSYAFTIPSIYRKALGLKFGDYVEVSLWDQETLLVKRHEAPKVQ